MLLESLLFPIANLQFHGDEIETFEHEGARYVAMRRVVENIGLDWARQSVKLSEQKEKFNCCHMSTVGADGKAREMICMPVEKLPLWLACINPNKVAESIRPKLELYQAESAIGLHDALGRPQLTICMPVEKLQRYGRCSTVAHLKSGNSSDHYYLNEGQTCVICAKSEASKAPEDPRVRSERKFT